MKRRRNPHKDMIEFMGKVVAVMGIAGCFYYTVVEIIWPWLQSLLQ